MSHKKLFGQFFTTNSDLILQGFEKYIRGKKITDPFAGKGDLLTWAAKHGAKSTLGYDIDPHYVNGKTILSGDSLQEMRIYDFVLTNPPYLYQNKLKEKTPLHSSKHTDLYQLALEKILNTQEGIAIVPINFLSAENSKYIRTLFLDRFCLERVNYFTEKVFEDTSYNVMSFYFRRKQTSSDIMDIYFTFYPEGKSTVIRLTKRHNWQIGGEFLSTIKSYKNRLGIERLEEKDLQSGNHELVIAHNHIKNKRLIQVNESTYKKLKQNIILLKAIDSGKSTAEGNFDGRICLEDLRRYNCHGLVSIKTSRNQISLLFPPYITIADQEDLISLFNTELESKRAQYYSLFMTNYRDKDRKRISFNFAYNFINYLYQQKLCFKRAGNVKNQPTLF